MSAKKLTTSSPASRYRLVIFISVLIIAPIYVILSCIRIFAKLDHEASSNLGLALQACTGIFYCVLILMFIGTSIFIIQLYLWSREIKLKSKIQRKTLILGVSNICVAGFLVTVITKNFTDFEDDSKSSFGSLSF